MKKIAAVLCLVFLFGLPTAQAVTVSAARALPAGTQATIDNVVLTVVLDQILSGTSKAIYGQDATGGVTLFGANASIDAILAGPDTVFGNGDDLVPGSRIDLTGSTTNFMGLFEMTDTPFPLSATFDGFFGVPTPTAITLADIQNGVATGETVEGKLVRLQNVTFTSAGNFAGVTNYTVSNGALSGVVRVSTGALPIAGTAIPTGPVDVIGVVTQVDSTAPFDSGYQILLSTPADLIPVPEPTSIALAGVAVLGIAFDRSRRRHVQNNRGLVRLVLRQGGRK